MYVIVHFPTLTTIPTYYSYSFRTASS